MPRAQQPLPRTNLLGSATNPRLIANLPYTSPSLTFASTVRGVLPPGMAQCGSIFSYSTGFAFRWQAPASGTVKATTCGYTKADTMMAVLLGDSPTGPWRCIRSNDDDTSCAASAGNEFASTASAPCVKGKYYLFVVAEYEGNLRPDVRLRVTGPANKR